MEYIVSYVMDNGGQFDVIYETDSLEQIIDWVEDELQENGGSLANIYSDGKLIEYVEI